MIRTAFVLTALGLVLLAGRPVAGQEVFRSAHHDFRVVTVADGLVNPWSMAWLPGGDTLIGERPGRLRIVRNGTLLPDPVAGVPEVLAQGQRGASTGSCSSRWVSGRCRPPETSGPTPRRICRTTTA